MEFLFENPIFLVIIIGIISSIFNRLKGNNPEEDKPKPKRRVQPAPSRPASPAPQQVNPNPRPVDRQKRVQPVGSPSVTSKPVADILLEVRKSAEKEINSRIDNQATANQYTSRNQESTKAVMVEKPNSFGIDSNRLIDGLIWSEVLGPPRAKRTHSAMRSMYRTRR